VLRWNILIWLRSGERLGASSCIGATWGSVGRQPLGEPDPWAALVEQALALGGEVNYLTPGEGAKADAVNFVVLDRIWGLWTLRVVPSLGK